MREQSPTPSMRNRKAWHDYHIEETLEAGLVLVGTEVKSVRAGKVTLTGGYVTIDGGEAWLQEVYIAPYEQSSQFNVVDPRRKRKLLLNRREIAKLQTRVQSKGYTLVPLAIYFKRGYAKLEIGLAKGKRDFDKRESLRTQQADRDKARALHSRNHDD